jgi:hypothetical protein
MQLHSELQGHDYEPASSGNVQIEVVSISAGYALEDPSSDNRWLMDEWKLEERPKRSKGLKSRMV